MQSARVVFLMIIFAVMAVGSYAQTCPAPTTACPTCPSAPVAMQPTCPTGTCGQPCPPAMVIPPSCAILGGLGGGPLAILESTCAGPEFDRLYIENMFQIHTDITALTTQGIEQTTDKGLRNLSGKIRTEQSDQNTKLAMWYRDMGLGRVKVDYCKSGTIINCLTNLCGAGFDPVYAQTLSDALKTLRDSALVSAPKLSRSDMKHQAELVARTAQNEIDILQKWISTHGTVPEKY
ncbi:MAG: DUF305 domain-containing protein [Armatimonadetes bacterium]|nr:DUF305 domain-containing protein [Armatimonadota bacterium]